VKANYEWDWPGAERLFKRAIGLNPNYGQAHHGYAGYLAALERAGDGVAEAQRAHAVEPLSGVYAANVVWRLCLARQYKEAEEEARRFDQWDGYILASLYLQIGRQREAVAMQKDAAKPYAGVLELMYLGHALGATGARVEGRKVLDQMLSLLQRRYVPPEYIAVVYEGLGERERALKWFEKAYSEHSMNIWVLPDPQLDSLRSDPRFEDILRRMGLPQ
jgi:tetratricopeptide (TPR) repeat protein